MKVYVVIGDYDVVGVFANKEDAIKQKEFYNYCAECRGSWATYTIKECEVEGAE